MPMWKIKEPYLIKKIWAADSMQRWGNSGIGEALLCSGDVQAPLQSENGEPWGRELQRQKLFFPYQIKAIAAAYPLSVQVHPAAKNEVWYVDWAEKDAAVYVGWRQVPDWAELASHCRQGTVLSLLNRLTVQSGDLIYVPGGTPHAIGGGIGLYEIGDIGSVTYRLYDYGRSRPLQPAEFWQHAAKNPLKLLGENAFPYLDFFAGGGMVTVQNTAAVLVTAGQGILYISEQQVIIAKDSCFLLTRGERFHYEGTAKLLTVTAPVL